ncbi:MAG: phosphohistidine phosphatase SixA [Candidatus Eremiobacteraeota bacterium]|nr:phosphohistidine phosphatase SixA [Candidatus Eremiobacteraeota bacterium]MCW5866214.1 phosphohistidine phosphatase SixA [Candidatus Eremiobacteraeota bacterium]
MYVYLMQHGEALSEENAPGRPLSLTGIEQVKATALFAYRAQIRIPTLYHSGKLRARRSAELLSDEVGGEVIARAGLLPKDDVTAVAEWLQSQEEDLALVGHLPFLDRLAGLLLSGDPDKSLVHFRFGVLVRLLRGENGWKVDWMVRP